MTENSTQKQIIDLILRSNKILITPSVPLDGDSLGSAISLYIALKKLNKDITVISSEDIPEVLQFLPNIKIVSKKILSTNDFIITLDCKNAKVDTIKTEKEEDKINIIITPKEGQLTEDDINFTKGKKEYDLIITVDCAELKQLKDFYEKNIELFHEVPVINIDHHVSNSHFGKINHVDIMASSTTELVLPILEEIGKKQNIDLIDEDVATLLLTGIITDTGSFQNANTTPKAFAVSAHLIAYGARQQEIIQHIYKTKQLSQLKLWGRVLSKIQTDEKYRIVWSVVNRQDFKDTGSHEEQTGDVIDELMTNAPGAEIILLIKEKEDKTISVSIRTTSPQINAAKIAEKFGGGGHNQAAGFKILNKEMRDTEYEIINYLREFQKERLGLNIEKNETMINVEELIKRAKEAENLTELMPKPEENNEKPLKKKKESKKSTTFEPKNPKIESQEEPKEEENKTKTVYRFED